MCGQKQISSQLFKLSMKVNLLPALNTSVSQGAPLSRSSANPQAGMRLCLGERGCWRSEPSPSGPERQHQDPCGTNRDSWILTLRMTVRDRRTELITAVRRKEGASREKK